ncbi:DUF4434 domain-containing protein [Leifsonia xyli]|uniref:DUF4434 domain-containing protein n=1 Tax=Leifsonia xyli TaxID=1575 RepID=UPI000B09C336
MRRIVSSLAAVAIAVAATVVPSVGAQAATDCRSITKRFSAEFISPHTGATADGIDPATGTSWGWWDSNVWNQEMALAQRLCVDDVILQWTAENWAGTDVPAGMSADAAPPCVQTDSTGAGVRTLYPSSVPAWEKSRLSYSTPSGCVQDDPAKPKKRQDVVGLALAAAKATGRKVWLGLLLQNHTEMDNTTWMARQTTYSEQVASELWARYGQVYADQIAGFYLPFEGDNVQYSPDPTSGVACTRYVNLLDYTKKVTARVRELAGAGVRIMTSPYHVAATSATAARQSSQQTAFQTYRKVVAALTTGTGVTTYAPQDNLGAGSDPSAAAGWMAAARQGIDDARAAGSDVDLWANIEQYSQQGEGSQPLGQLLAHMDDVNAAAMVGDKRVLPRIDHFIGFSLANFDTNWFPKGQTAGLRAAYAHYLANPGSTLSQNVPAVSNLTATAVASSLDVSVQWSPVASMPTPAPGVAPAPVLGYVVYRDGVQLAHVGQRFTSQTDANGFYAVDASGPSTFTDPSVPTGKTFTYEVAAFDSYGNLSPRSQVQLVVPIGAADVLSSSAVASTNASLRVSDNAPYSAVVHDGNPENIWDAINAGDSAGTYADGRPVAKAVDGHIGEPRYEDPAWIGLGTGSTAVTDVQSVEIDLPSPVGVHAVRTNWLSDGKVGVRPPDPNYVSVSTRNQASQVEGTPYEPLTAPGEVSSGINPDGSTSGVVIPNPGTGWYTTGLLGASERIASSVRVSVTQPGGDPWAFLSEVQVLNAAGKNVCDGGACTARVLNLSGDVPTTANRYAPMSGRTLTSPNALRSADGTLSPLTYSWDVVSNSVGWLRSTPFDLVVDLGVERPIGQISSDWFNTQGSAHAPTVSVSVLPDSSGSGAPDLSPSAAWTSVTTSRTDTGTLTTYTASTGGGSPSGATVRARWVKLVVVPSDSWNITTNLTVKTPEAFDAARCGNTCAEPPRLYKTSSDTTANPGTVAPLAASGAAVPVGCRPTGTTCATDSAAGSATITKPMPATDRPDYSYIRANGLTLLSSPSWDVVAPVGTSDGTGVSRIASPTISMVYAPNMGSILPTSIDLYTASSGGPAVDSSDPDGSRPWRSTGVNAGAPKLPTYVPGDTAFIYTYTFPEVVAADGQRVEALRFHLNTRNQLAIVTRVQAGVWK